MPKIVKAFIQIYTCLILFIFLWNSINFVRYPYGVDYGEAPLMDQVRRIEKREILYKSDINEPPYVITNYPPLYASTVAAINSIFQIPSFQAGRITSSLFAIICGVILALLTYQVTGDKWLGILSLALFLGQPFVITWSSFARVDFMALAFSLLGLWVLLRYPDSRYGYILACFLFLLAVYTRQTYLLAAPLAGFMWLWHLDKKKALIFISLFGVSGLLIFGIINAVTHGGFYVNIVVSNLNRNDYGHWKSMVNQLFNCWPIILTISGIIALVSIYSKFRTSQKRKDPTLIHPFIFFGIVFYSIGAVIIAVTAIKVGSNINYFLELIAICAIWFCLALKLLQSQNKILQWTLWGIFFLQFIWTLTYSYQVSRINSADLSRQLAARNALDPLVLSASQIGNVLSDDYMDLIVISDQSVYYQPFEYGELYYAGQWDPTNFVQQIERGEFPLIIIGGTSLDKHCCWPPPVIDALESNYQIENGNNILILTPNE